MKNKEAIDLLNKFQDGTITEQELAMLEGWYNHKAGFGKVEMTDQELDNNLSIIWERLPAGKARIIRLWPRVAVAVAVAVVIFGAGLFYFTKSNIDNMQIANNQVQINPGGNKAILTLADGTKISLSDAKLGEVAAQSGVRISKTADGQLVYDASGSANSNKQIEYNTIEAPVGGQWQVKLPDGSLVFLNALSSITYPTKFVDKERNVKISGEAYFEIAHNKEMPFKVSSQGQTVEVLGTHFDIMAYSDEKVVKTTLLEGSVKIANGGRTQILKPGEQAQVSADGIKVSDEVDLEDVVAWKNGYFKFNENLESILNKVARWYNVEVVYQQGLNRDQSFSGKILRSKDISSVLKIMELTEKVHFKIEGRQIIVMK